MKRRWAPRVLMAIGAIGAIALVVLFLRNPNRRISHQADSRTGVRDTSKMDREPDPKDTGGARILDKATRNPRGAFTGDTGWRLKGLALVALHVGLKRSPSASGGPDRGEGPTYYHPDDGSIFGEIRLQFYGLREPTQLPGDLGAWSPCLQVHSSRDGVLLPPGGYAVEFGRIRWIRDSEEWVGANAAVQTNDWLQIDFEIRLALPDTVGKFELWVKADFASLRSPTVTDTIESERVKFVVKRIESPADEVPILLTKIEQSRQRREFDTVVKLCDEVLAKNPRRARAWGRRGDALRKLERYAEALDSYRRYAKLLKTGEYEDESIRELEGSAIEHIISNTEQTIELLERRVKADGDK